MAVTPVNWIQASQALQKVYGTMLLKGAYFILQVLENIAYEISSCSQKMHVRENRLDFNFIDNIISITEFWREVVFILRSRATECSCP